MMDQKLYLPYLSILFKIRNILIKELSSYFLSNQSNPPNWPLVNIIEVKNQFQNIIKNAGQNLKSRQRYQSCAG